MATRGKSTDQGFIITNADIDVSKVNRSIRKILGAIKSILTLGWIPDNKEINIDKFDVDKAREVQMSKLSKTADMAHLYSKRF